MSTLVGTKCSGGPPSSCRGLSGDNHGGCQPSGHPCSPAEGYPTRQMYMWEKGLGPARLLVTCMDGQKVHSLIWTFLFYMYFHFLVMYIITSELDWAGCKNKCQYSGIFHDCYQIVDVFSTFTCNVFSLGLNILNMYFIFICFYL